MQFDDRLATVLRMRADSEGVLRTQFRQLVDLLGTSRDDNESLLRDEAYGRLGEIMAKLPQEEQSRILREPGLRLRNSDLVAFIAAGNAKPAASAMATARLTDTQWIALIPTLPVNARGFLRHRRDLSPKVKELLARLGVQDLVLPDPRLEDSTLASVPEAPPRPAPEAKPKTAPAAPQKHTRGDQEGIGALVRRIERFREERRAKPVAPRLPLGEEEIAHTPLMGFEFATDANGLVTWASGPIAPLVVGLQLTSSRPGMLVTIDASTAASLASYQPVHTAKLTLDAAREISGDWRMDAAPLFDRMSGRFKGYRGCLRRPMAAEKEAQRDSEGDQMRQVLHELRTPVNAIQGFAEIIQQQLFGPAPHEYRAHAAGISVDAAKLLAAFDEVDRLVKLDSGAMELEDGETDFRVAIADTTQRLQAVLRPRDAGFDIRVKGSPFMIGIARSDAMALCWRILATAAGALGPGETIALRLSGNEQRVRLRLKVPESLRVKSDLNRRPSGEAQRERAVSAGMFGPTFAFKLARAEAEAAGGTLKCKKDRVTLWLPSLTASTDDHSADAGRASGEQSA